MTKTEVLSILTKPEKQRLERRGVILNCHRCEKPIELGDSFVRKRHSGRIVVSGAKASHVKYYHERCWNGLFH